MTKDAKATIRKDGLWMSINKVRELIGKIAASAAEAVFPADIYCICCGSIIDSTRTYSLCDSCIEKFQWIGLDTCRKCGKPLGKDDPHDLCHDCRTVRHHFDRGYTCCLYDLYARAVIMDLKYRDKSYLGRIVGDILADRMQAAGGQISEGGQTLKDRYDIVIPVPVSPRRMEQRGYNQAALIAARFSEKSGIPMDDRVIVREDRKMAMKDLDAMQRRLNVRDAFLLTEHGKEMLDGSGKRIVVVDDIYTTGATVDECARVLKSSGASKVDVLSFAAGRNYVPRGAALP